MHARVCVSGMSTIVTTKEEQPIDIEQAIDKPSCEDAVKVRQHLILSQLGLSALSVYSAYS